MLYEIRTESNSWMLHASNDADAERSFCAMFAEYGDPVPAHWIVARWSVHS